MNNKSFYLFYWVCFFIGMGFNTPVGRAQNFEQTCTQKIGDTDKSIVDFSGNIFVTTVNGDILKFNNQCQEVLVFSPIKTGRIKQIDIWSQFKIFAFYEELQEYVVLNRFLASPIRYRFASLNLGYISNATLNFQQNLWVVDESDFSLKLIDQEHNEVVIIQQLSQYLDASDHNITYLKEHKGRLYLVDQNAGILLFDNLGNYLSTVNLTGLTSINFEKGKLFSYSERGLVEILLNTMEINELNHPKGDFKNLLYNNDTFYCFSNEELQIYQYLSND